MTVSLMPLSYRRTCSWAEFPSAARGYLGGELKPGTTSNEGIVTVAGVPAGRQVIITHRMSSTVVDSTFSAPDGTWRVDDLPSADYYDVRVIDYAGTYADVYVSRRLPWTG